jgi:hypothetical protein
MDDRNRPDDLRRATSCFLNYVVLPVWIVAGFADYVCHRKSKIETTSGTHESLTHALMIVSAGIGVAARLFCEPNEAVLRVMAASALTHEAIVIWDIGYASKMRPPSALEQHIHSLLEILPFVDLAMTGCSYPRTTAALLKGDLPRVRSRLTLKKDAISSFQIAVVLSSALFQVLPYTEEFVRCFRIDHTLLPHD